MTMDTRNRSLGAFMMAMALILGASGLTAQQNPVFGPDDDPRVGLGAGWMDAEEASWHMNLVAHLPRPEGFYNPETPGDGRFSNTDLAFQGDLVFVGNYHGINIYDISDPASPRLRTSIICPGGQGDVSVFRHLLFMSAQETRGRVDCGTQGVEEPVSPERFRGVRIFDISDLDNPVQVAAVQTCRGSHTHTVVTDPNDAETLYVYNSGTSGSRPGEELPGCVDVRDPEDPTTAYWSIDVIQVPLAAPEEARLIDSPRVFADEATGRIAGLWQGGPHGEDTQESRETDRCHDITAYPEIGLAAGACSGNGILFDISDPAVPVRVDEVIDPNFAYWHSATFSNDGSTVIFTDEWGGGSAPRCLATDRPEWGANALFEVVDGRMQLAGYYKLPAPQTELENCVAHNGSLVPVPGRDIKVQAWYQGGVSVFDFSDPANPFEIAFFDRGPLSDEELFTGGYWSTYWYNGYIYGSEISRGLDVLELVPSEFLSENELEAARLVTFDEFNPQHQPRNVWPPEMVVARAFFDQMMRHDGLDAGRAAQVSAEMDRIEAMADGPDKGRTLAELATGLRADARAVDRGTAAGDAERIRRLAGSLMDMAAAHLLSAPLDAQESTWWDPADRRIGLAPGWMNAEEAAMGMELVSATPRPEGFYDPDNVGNLNLANSDLAFQGDLVFVGNFHGINIYDVSDPAAPVLRTSIVCPGGQGDVSVYGDLLFMSVEQGRGRLDCGTQGTSGQVDPERFRGVRIFDIANLDNPVQVAAVQTCRGSHTHSILEDASDPDHVYVYVSGAAGVRPEAELAGCRAGEGVDPDASALFRIEVIRVPLAAPQDAEVVSAPRVFADHRTGDVAGLWPGGAHGEGTQRSSQTNHCHDITIYPALGLAAGACSGNGILLDISDPVNPVRIDEVIDPNFAYWHSATFNNDGTSVIFTDEWGGGTAARCRAEDPPEWGANAIFRLAGGRMEHRSYYKLPVPQEGTENCVAHNGSLVPVPGRDIKVQSWYQGGISVFDFTDPANPFEIAYFDRGPIDGETLYTGGHWSAYWHNGLVYGSEIARGLDVLRLTPSGHLTENELRAAELVRFDEFNPQHQPRIVWPADMVVARAYFDQLVRHQGIAAARAQEVATEMDRIEAMPDSQAKRTALQDLATGLWADARSVEAGDAPGDAERIRRVAGALLDVAGEIQ